MNHNLCKTGDANLPNAILDSCGAVSLDLCKVCGGAEAALPTECPGVRLTPEQLDEVQAGRLDFRGGSWTRLRSPRWTEPVMVPSPMCSSVSADNFGQHLVVRAYEVLSSSGVPSFVAMVEAEDGSFSVVLVEWPFDVNVASASRVLRYWAPGELTYGANASLGSRYAPVHEIFNTQVDALVASGSAHSLREVPQVSPIQEALSEAVRAALWAACPGPRRPPSYSGRGRTETLCRLALERWQHENLAEAELRRVSRLAAWLQAGARSGGPLALSGEIYPVVVALFVWLAGQSQPELELDALCQSPSSSSSAEEGRRFLRKIPEELLMSLQKGLSRYFSEWRAAQPPEELRGSGVAMEATVLDVFVTDVAPHWVPLVAWACSAGALDQFRTLVLNPSP